MMIGRCARVVAVAALLGLASAAQAGVGTFTAEITRVLVSDTSMFGGCMTLLNVSPASTGIDCPAGGWVTYSCSGDFNAKDIAYRKLDNATLAFALGKQVLLQVDDTKKYNGFCFVSRIDVLPNDVAP